MTPAATSAAGGAAALTVSTLVFVGTGFLGNLVLIHLLPVAGDYGRYGVLTALMTALNILQVNGLPQAVSRFIAAEPARAPAVLRSSLKLQLGVSLVLVVVFVAGAPLFSRAENDPGLTGLVRLTGVILPLYGAFTLIANGYYNGLRLFTRQALLNIVYALAKFALLVAGALVFGLPGVMAAFILAPLAALLLARPRLGGSGSFPARTLIVAALPLMGYSLLATAALSVDLFAVKGLLSADTHQADLYTAAQSVAIVPYWVLAVLNQVLFPAIARGLAAGRLTETTAAINATLRYYLMGFVPMAVALVGTARESVPLVLGTGFAAAVPALQVLVAAYLPLTLFNLMATVLNAAGRARVAMACAGAGVLVTACLCPLLIPHLHLIGAALATGIGSTVAAAAAVLVLRRSFPIRLDPRTPVRIALAGAVAAAVAFLPVPHWAFPLLALASVAGYAAVLFVTREFTADDRARLTSLRPGRAPAAGR